MPWHVTHSHPDDLRGGVNTAPSFTFLALAGSVSRGCPEIEALVNHAAAGGAASCQKKLLSGRGIFWNEKKSAIVREKRTLLNAAVLLPGKKPPRTYGNIFPRPPQIARKIPHFAAVSSTLSADDECLSNCRCIIEDCIRRERCAGKWKRNEKKQQQRGSYCGRMSIGRRFAIHDKSRMPFLSPPEIPCFIAVSLFSKKVEKKIAFVDVYFVLFIAFD